MKLKLFFIFVFFIIGLSGCDVDEIRDVEATEYYTYEIDEYEDYVNYEEDEKGRLAQEKEEAVRLEQEQLDEINALASHHGLVEAIVTNIVDGDTIDVRINGVEERVRFIGIDTPERGESGFTEATEFVRHEIAEVGDVVWLQSSGNNRDRFERLRRYIWLGVPSSLTNEYERHELLLNQRLLDANHAVIMAVGGEVGSLTGPTSPKPVPVIEEAISNNANGETVYWTVNGNAWHRTRDCRGLRNANERNIRSGTIAESGKASECNFSARGGQ